MEISSNKEDNKGGVEMNRKARKGKKHLGNEGQKVER